MVSLLSLKLYLINEKHLFTFVFISRVIPGVINSLEGDVFIGYFKDIIYIAAAVTQEDISFTGLWIIPVQITTVYSFDVYATSVV